MKGQSPLSLGSAEAVARAEPVVGAVTHEEEEDAFEAVLEQDDAGSDIDSLPHATCALYAPASEPPEFLVRPLIVQGDIGAVVAAGGSGKSTVVTLLSCSIAGGYDFLDRFPVRRVPVLYVSEEDAASIIINRLDAMIAGHHWDRVRVKENFHFLALEGVSLDSTAWQVHLQGEALRLGVGLIVLDPYFDLTSAPENDNSAQKPVIAFIRSLAKETGATVTVVHHITKPTWEGRAKIDRLRGNTALRDAARFAYWIEATEGGMSVECLKLNRTEKPRPFVVARTIVSDPSNEAIWLSARFNFMTAQAAVLVKGERFVVEQIERAGRLNTSELKDAAKGTGISGADISAAISALQGYGTINFELGPKNAKLWGLVAKNVRQPANGLIACLPELAGQPAETPRLCLPCPYRGQAGKHGGWGWHGGPVITCEDLLDQVHSCGAEVVRLEPDRLRLYDHAGAVTPELKDELRSRRAELLAYLAPHPCNQCGKFSFPIPGVVCFWCRAKGSK